MFDILAVKTLMTSFPLYDGEHEHCCDVLNVYDVNENFLVHAGRTPVTQFNPWARLRTYISHTRFSTYATALSYVQWWATELNTLGHARRGD